MNRPKKYFSDLPKDSKRIRSLFVKSNKEIWDMYQKIWNKKENQ